jgi:hypothetical protein
LFTAGFLAAAGLAAAGFFTAGFLAAAGLAAAGFFTAGFLAAAGLAAAGFFTAGFLAAAGLAAAGFFTAGFLAAAGLAAVGFFTAAGLAAAGFLAAAGLAAVGFFTAAGFFATGFLAAAGLAAGLAAGFAAGAFFANAIFVFLLFEVRTRFGTVYRVFEKIQNTFFIPLILELGCNIQATEDRSKREVQNPFYAMDVFTQSESCPFDIPPTLVATTCPSLKTMKVGMPRIPYFVGVFALSSIFILTTLTCPANSVESSSIKGDIILHGPHHSAQKSTTTGWVDFKTSASKF